MRYEKGHKVTSRRRILDVASRLFREHGISETGISDIMTAAGMTNGAFYAHFESKEALVREAVHDALEQQLESMMLGDGEPLDLATVVSRYLDRAHRDAPGAGCPSAAMLPELARQPYVTRATYTQGIGNIARLLGRAAGADPAKKQSAAMSVFALVLGSLQLARAVTDPGLSDQILTQGRDAALALIERSVR